MLKIIESCIIYENPLPQLKSIQSYFPFLCQCKNGKLAAVHVLGEAFESVDGASHISFSNDGGRSWSKPRRMFDKSGYKIPITDYCKVCCLPDGRLLALGYAYLRANPELPIGNCENGGVLDDFLFYSISDDHGMTWSDMAHIDCVWGPHAEASAPVTVLKDGTWISPITGFPDWEGNMTETVCGRALRSEDQGNTWDDDSICMEFAGKSISCYEQRMCQLESGAIICIGWNEDMKTGERFENHYTVSFDNGRTWSKPETTGVMGQASSVCSIGGNRFLALHAVRRDTNRPGIYGCVIDFSEKTWHIIEQCLLWEPKSPMKKNDKLADIFSYVKFGQPGAILLEDGDVMMSHWYEEDGQYKTVATRIQL